MKRFTLIGMAVGLILAAAAVLPASPEQPVIQAQSDLTWFVFGLKNLGQSREARLKLQPAQAKKLLPVLEGLAKEKILLLEVPTGRIQRGGPPSGQSGGGPGPGGITEEERRAMEARGKKVAERIREAIDRMDAVLRQEQSNYILNLDFDPADYGLESRQPMLIGNQGKRPSQAEIEKMRQARQAAMERLVKLNRETLEMLKKLAAG